MFLEISQNSQGNTCARVSFLIKLPAAPATLFKKRLWHRYFPINFAKLLRTATDFFISASNNYDDINAQSESCLAIAYSIHCQSQLNNFCDLVD